MCCSSFLIKPVNPTASKKIYCQCGFCEDCRRSEREMWSFRLQAEMLGRLNQGWKSGFFTLTYNEENLPVYYLDGCDSDGVVSSDIDPWDAEQVSCFPCFSRSDVRNFILSIRKKLHRDYGIKGISYMICSEYGHKGRPHYHGVISWPPLLDAQQMYSIICQFWRKGFVFPKDYRGGVDSHGYKHNPFEVDSVVQSAKYCAKYVCKDLNFYRDAIDLGIDVKNKKFRKEYAPFHIQNRGLGQQFLVDLSDSQKVDLLINGYSFVGSDYMQKLPLYFRNKLIFDTHYVYDIFTKNRLVRRQANSFFERYKFDIYEAKVKSFTSIFDSLKSFVYDFNRFGEFLSNNVDYLLCLENRNLAFNTYLSDLENAVNCISSVSSDMVARYFLSYYGVPSKYRLRDPVQSWFNHFTQFYVERPENDVLDLPDFDFSICTLFHISSCLHNPKNPDQDFIDYVADFHKHME